MSAGDLGVTAKATIRGVRIGPPDDPGHRGDAALDERGRAIPAPGWPTTTRSCVPTWISARHRSASLRTSVTRPVTVTRRHSCATPGAMRRTAGAGVRPLPRTVNASTRRRGAPYATPIRPSARIRVPTLGAVAPVGSRSSMAPAGVLDDDPSPGRVEEARGRRHDGIDGHGAIGDPQGLGDGHGPGGGARRGADRTRGCWRRRRRRCPADDEVRAVADPDPIPIEDTGAAGTLPDDADDPIGRADLERSDGDPARDVGRDLDGRPTVSLHEQRDVAGGRPGRLPGQASGRRDEATFEGLVQGRGTDRQRRGQCGAPEHSGSPSASAGSRVARMARRASR